MKKIILVLTMLLSFNIKAEGASNSELSTVLTVAPFYLTTEAIVDPLTKNEFEEARDIAADGVITEEERQEMSVELRARMEECEYEIFDFEDDVACLRWLARFDD